MFGLGIPEVIVILIVLGLLLFGNAKISDLARTLGRFTGEFKKGKLEIEEELRKVGEDVASLKDTVKRKEK